LVSKFIFEDIICRHRLPVCITNDNGPENSALTTELLRRYNIKRILISSYHPQGNGMVERGHQPIVNALAKHAATHNCSWVDALHIMMWADRTTVEATTGRTSASLKYGAEHILPMDTAYVSLSGLDWLAVQSTEDLLTLRCRQLERRDEDLEEIVLQTRRMREKNKEAFDAAHFIRTEELNLGDLVLLWDIKKEKDKSSVVKLQPRWLEPYKIIRVAESLGSYRIAELDGAILQGPFAGKRLKKFRLRAKESGLDQTIARAPSPQLYVAIPPLHSDLADLPVIQDNDIEMTAKSEDEEF
jgi:hypothetical protein